MKKTIQNFSFIVVFVALLGGCAIGQQQSPYPRSRIVLKDQIAISVKTEAAGYQQYEPIFVTVSIKNASKRPVKDFFWNLEFETCQFNATVNGKDKLPLTSYGQATARKYEERRRTGVVDIVSGPLRIKDDLEPGGTYTQRMPLQEFVDLSGLNNVTLSLEIERFGVKSNKMDIGIGGLYFDLYDPGTVFYLKKELNKRFPTKQNPTQPTARKQTGNSIKTKAAPKKGT